MPVAIDERRISRAIKEAAHILTEAYQSNKTLKTYFEKSEAVLFNLFRNMVQTAWNRSSVIQVEGCKGVLVWSDQPFHWSQLIQTSKYARLLSFCGHKSVHDKIRRHIMAEYPKYIIISFIGVLEQEQGKGYGKALMTYLLEKVKVPIYVEVINDTKSVKFFESFGFVAQGEMPLIVKEQVVYLVPMVHEPSL
ncbi:hypothetical protein G6F64_007472 [Rhizopus arrhizus]|uniref:N-acetyltransferase domain-containing protein n=1 Tax=Rhizopus oryzae TaxID=64495 RepID=A0A9P7BRH4_RHIOR|nr:hypothetical protein G6F64_007472 [Rhizopus arrhizus]